MTTTEDSSAPTAQELRRRMALPVGIVWVCGTCRQQGHVVHPSVDAARHDAGRHALAAHGDTVALAEIELRLVDAQDVDVRRQQRHPDARVRTLLPVEDPFTRLPPLSPLQEELLCDVLGCDPQARHLRRRPA
ncbi:hypothetical protein ACQKM2_35805 [Streptomyces sp. NPDC004126]|uniref:hypothetical protein n=1 Tax=Streptomyces sp. NPDC004126 TaxID=3390695 RepID=UPI003CFD5AC3